MFTKNQTNPYFQAVRVGTETAAKALGVKVIQYIPTKPDSIPEQLSQVEDVIVKKPDAIIFIPVDYKALVPRSRRSTRPAFRSPTSPTASPAAIRRLCRRRRLQHRARDRRILMKAMGGKGNVMILEGVKGSLTNTDRVRGFNDAIKENPNVKLLASQPANYQRLNALQVMENLMQSFPQIDGVLAANDPMAVGAIEALEGANRKALVVGINGSKEAVELIKSGKLLARATSTASSRAASAPRSRAQPAQGADPEGSHPQAGGDREEQFGPYEVPVEQRTCPKLGDVATN